MVKKLYIENESKGLSYKNAMGVIIKDGGVITRPEWDGFHFISTEGVYCILLKSGELLRNVDTDEVYNKDSNDWIVTEATMEAKDILAAYKVEVRTSLVKFVMSSVYGKMKNLEVNDYDYRTK